MPNVTVRGFVRAPPAKVFAFVADLENWPKWQEDMKAVVREGGAAGAKGAKYRYKAEAMGQKFDSTVEIVAVEPSRMVAFEGEWAGMIRPRGTYTFEPADGGTMFTAHLTPEARGFGKVMTPFMNVMIRRINRRHLEKLRRALE